MSKVTDRKRPAPKHPAIPDPRVIGEGLRRALMAAGYRQEIGEEIVPDYAKAARTLSRAGVHFTRNTLCSLCQGYRQPSAARVLTIVAILGLNLRTAFDYLYDSEGRQITRKTHPERFRQGARIDPLPPIPQATNG